MTNFQNFSTGPVDRYAGYFRNHGCLLLFQHIPKTAGSSLTRELASTLPPYRNIHVAANGDADGRHRGDALMDEVEAFIEDHKTRRYTSASGHLRQPHVRRLGEAVANAKVFSFLRDPAERLISDYRYAKTPKHPPHQEFARRYPTIEDYIEDPANNNKMWRFVRPGSSEATTESIRLVFRRYVFFGTVAKYSQHFQFLSGLVTCPRAPSVRINVTTEQSNNAVALSADLKSRIEQTNADDYAFYAAVTRILDDKEQAMAEFVRERRSFFGMSAASDAAC